MISVVFPLAYPVQRYGVGRGVSYKDTHEMPTFSAIVGMVANALGRFRDDPIDDLIELGFAVRVDDAGSLMVDLQTNQVHLEEGIHSALFLDKSLLNATWLDVLKDVEYLEDAKFTVALSSEDEDLIRRVAMALEEPARALYLGTASCVIGSIEETSTVESDAVEALASGSGHVHATTRSGEKPSYSVMDRPLSFASGRRRYASRDVTVFAARK